MIKKQSMSWTINSKTPKWKQIYLQSFKSKKWTLLILYERLVILELSFACVVIEFWYKKTVNINLHQLTELYKIGTIKYSLFVYEIK